MTAGSPVSVVIRAKDEAASIGGTLERLHGQALDRPLEIVVVDSGSRDATAEIARAAGASVVGIPASSFTFGGSLNRGCAEASGDVIVALSAHAFPPDPGWLARIIEPLEDQRVACASGDDFDPWGRPLGSRLVQDAELAARFPHWGYSSAAGAFRAELWRERGFRADLPGTEDKEWAWHWLQRGRLVVIGPDLVADHGHSKDPIIDQFRRSRREWVGFRMYLELGPYRARDLLREWWQEQETYRAPHRARLSPRRGARLAGKYAAWRRPPGAVGDPSETPSQRSLRLAVMIDAFPVLSETFVRSEIAELRRQGHQVRVEAIADVPAPDRTADADLPVAFMTDESRGRKLLDLCWLVGRHPLAAARDLRDRRGWRREEDVRPLRALAVRARRISDAGIEHLHVHFATGSALDAYRLGRILGLPYSVTAHAYDVFLAPRNLALKLERSAFSTSVCDYTVRHLRTLVAPEHAPRIHAVTMGIDSEAFRRTTPHPGGGRMVAVGRLIEKKGFTFLIDAAARLRETGELGRVTIVGEGPLRPELEAQVAALGLEDMVELAGAQSAEVVQEALEGADVFVMPSVIAADGDRDSVPVAVYEALAMELPVVASDAVGLPEHVRPEWGRLVPPGDADALAAAISELLRLPAAERAAMGRAGRAHVVSSCNVTRQANVLATLIRAGVEDRWERAARTRG